MFLRTKISRKCLVFQFFPHGYFRAILNEENWIIPMIKVIGKGENASALE